jgi:membrane-bound lytic murein transglycosylase D
MLKRKLYTASLISCFILVAAASASRSVASKKANSSTVPYKKDSHQFDSSGLCSCVPVNTPLEDAPRIQLNKHVAGFVKQYNKKNGYFLNKAKAKVNGYFDIIDSVLSDYELPGELKYLAFIESGLKKITVSKSGAKGPWALMPVAAKQYGLKISGKDERLDYYRSTHAAARLLIDLYEKYNDWLLVIAAYNSGPGWIDKAIKRSGSRNYWALQQYLPKETQSHIRRFIATHYQFEGHGSLATMTRAETEAHIKAVASFTAKQQQVVPVIDSAAIVPVTITN